MLNVIMIQEMLNAIERERGMTDAVLSGRPADARAARITGMEKRVSSEIPLCKNIQPINMEKTTHATP